MRKASVTLKREINTIIAECGRPALRQAHGPQFNAAVGDVLADQPVSVKRENWMREKLGMRTLKTRLRRSYYRPCLSPELGVEILAAGWSNEAVEQVIWEALFPFAGVQQIDIVDVGRATPLVDPCELP